MAKAICLKNGSQNSASSASIVQRFRSVLPNCLTASLSVKLEKLFFRCRVACVRATVLNNGTLFNYELQESIRAPFGDALECFIAFVVLLGAVLGAETLSIGAPRRSRML